jgi:von Willebrand factor type A domain
MSAPRFAALATCLAASLVACGGSSGSVFTDGTTGSSGASGAPGAAGDQGAFSTDPVGTNAACVTAMKNASLPAVNLVLMYDKSGSMGDPAEGGDPKLKWIPVNTGMKSFFADPSSSGYNASLQFFPAPGDITATCGAPYASPLVPLTSLGQSQPLVAALDNAAPQGGTPTLPALEGAIAYAKTTAAARPDEKTVVVLVTDGEPGLMVNGVFAPGCPNNDVTHVAAAAADAYKGTPQIPTYVVGVGSSLQKLDAIAAAGGTSAAFVVPVSNPTETTAALQKAFESIRAQVKLSCDFALPSAPAGQTLDTGRVNVAFTSGAGAETPLVYSGDCSAANGWRYDDAAKPQRIELCGGACATAQGDRNGKLTVALGCQTNQTPK